MSLVFVTVDTCESVSFVDSYASLYLYLYLSNSIAKTQPPP